MPSIKVIFPTERNVLASRNGEMGAGTVCFQQQYWRDPMYPRSVMHDFECVGEMKGSLMHTKVRTRNINYQQYTRGKVRTF